MKLAKALKAKSRLVGEISKLTLRITACVSTIKENEYEEVFDKLVTEREKLVQSLMDLKVRIMSANIKGNMFATVLEMAELKTEMTMYSELPIKTGKQENAYRISNQLTEYKSQLTEAQRTAKVKEIQEKINACVDKLDEFNATTEL